MARTFFHDFVRDNGQPVTVEYEVDGSYSPTTYSPRYGADGGDAPTFGIIDCWPNEPWFDALSGRRNARSWPGRAPTLVDRICAAVLRWRCDFHRWWLCSLTDAERERMEAYLAENYVEEDDEADYWEMER